MSDNRCATVNASGSALQMLHEGLESARRGGLHDMGSRMKRLSLQSQTQMLHEGPDCMKRNTWELACQGSHQDICVHAIGIIRTMGLPFMQSLQLKCFAGIAARDCFGFLGHAGHLQDPMILDRRERLLASAAQLHRCAYGPSTCSTVTTTCCCLAKDEQAPQICKTNASTCSNGTEMLPPHCQAAEWPSNTIHPLRVTAPKLTQ